VLVAAGPARAEASVAKNPLGRGTVESHQLRIVTPLTTVNVGGSSDRDPGGGALCGLPVVDCGS
jgi:hypothetical protein